MARFAHGFEVLPFITLCFVAKVGYCDTDFDLSSASPGPRPSHTDFFTTTFMFQAFAATLALHTTTCSRCPTPNIGSNVCFPVVWIIACVPFFPRTSPFVGFWILASFAANGFPRLKRGLALSLAGFRCRAHEWLLSLS